MKIKLKGPIVAEVEEWEFHELAQDYLWNDLFSASGTETEEDWYNRLTKNYGVAGVATIMQSLLSFAIQKKHITFEVTYFSKGKKVAHPETPTRRELGKSAYIDGTWMGVGTDHFYVHIEIRERYLTGSPKDDEEEEEEE